MMTRNLVRDMLTCTDSRRANNCGWHAALLLARQNESDQNHRAKHGFYRVSSLFLRKG